MSRKFSVFIQLLTYGMLIGLSYETVLIGKHVRDALPNEFLFIVSIAKRSPKNDPNFFSKFVNRHFCTGSLISRKSVLTAAHCFRNKTKSDVEVIAGSAYVSLGDRYYPESWISYDDWRKDNNEVLDNYVNNDIGIITLKGKGITNPEIHPAAILTFDPADLAGSIVRIAGWGVSENGKKPIVLKTATLRVISNKECNERASKLINDRFVVPENYFCSSANPWVASTSGDSGAPILNKRNQVVGIHVGRCPNLNCSQEYRNENQINTHLHLYHYRNFIKSVKVST